MKLNKLYIDHIVDTWKSLSYLNETIEEYFTGAMNRVFEKTHIMGTLPKKYYVYWVCMLHKIFIHLI